MEPHGNGAPKASEPSRAIGERDYRVDGQPPSAVCRVADAAEVAEALRAAHAAGQAVIPWGAGSQMGLGRVPRRYDIALDLSGLHHIVEHDAPNLTVTVEAGARLFEASFADSAHYFVQAF